MTNLKFAALGLDHRHIFGMAAGIVEVGGEFTGYWTEGEPQPYSGFIKRFPDVPRFDELQSILDNQEISFVLIAAAPADRAKLSILAMSQGKDVMVDKPGCLTKAELADIKDCAAKTGRIWSINFSERFEVPATTRADELIAAGAIGEVVQTVSLAPHRLNAPMRPDWFWRPDQAGGILSDIGVHQIDQFLHFAGVEDAEIVHSLVGNFKNPKHCEFQDFGEINLLSGSKQGYARLDWYTPDAAPNWGDGRLTILGTDGYIELRKYMDVAGQSGTDHVFLVNNNVCTRFDASGAGTPYFARFVDDVRNRTETACSQNHTFRVMELALEAQERAMRRGNLQK